MSFLSKIKLTKKQKIFFILILFIFATAGGFWYLKLRLAKKELPQEETPQKEEIVEKEKYPCLLDGRFVNSLLQSKRRPLAVAIENHPAARPQSGLLQADLVYEALVEGGITRFLAFYVCGEAPEIGPVRSARGYFLDWLSEYEAIYVHCGGSPESLRLIRAYDIADLDQFYNPRYFWRVSFRSSPHNLYTNSLRLQQAISDKNLEKYSPYSSFRFKDEESSSPQKEEIIIYYSSKNFVVTYTYSPAENTYRRSQGGSPAKDRLSGRQLAPKNVIIIWTSSLKKDAYGRLGLVTIGKGKALFLIDGKVISGLWKKPSRTSRTKFYGKNGGEISFNRGQIWIQVVPLGTKVSY